MIRPLARTALLTALPILGFAAAQGGASIKLRPDASRDEIKAALTAAGHPADDATVDRLAANLALAGMEPAPKPATPAAPQAKKSLRLSPGASRDEIKAALADAGLPTDEATIEKIAAQITPAAAKPAAPQPLPATLTRPAEFYEFLKQNLACIDLEYAPVENQYFAAVRVNDKPGRFQIDSGAAYSIFALGALPKFGMTAKPAGRLAGGIGGAETAYITQFDSFRLGTSINIPKQQLMAFGMGKAADCDGLVGADILTAANALIDHRHHRFLHPYSDSKVDILAKAKEAGMQAIPLIREETHSLIDATINGHPVRLLLDTGAQQSLLDSETARRIGLAATASKLTGVGIGDDAQRMSITSVDDIAIGDTHLRRAPMLVTPLGHVQNAGGKKFDGILGAEFFYATEAVIDVGNRRLFLEPRSVKLSDFTKCGAEMFDTDAGLKAAHERSSWVGFARLASLSQIAGLEAKDPAGNKWIGVELTVIVTHTLKGAPLPPGSTHTFGVLVPDRPDRAAFLTGIFGRNPAKILFLNLENAAPAAIRPYHERVWTDGELPRAQLARILNLPVPPFPPAPAQK